LREMISARERRNPEYRAPALLHALTWLFLDGPANRALTKVASVMLKARS